MIDISVTTAALAMTSGVIIGALLALLGVGGSVLATPLLLYVVGVRDPHIPKLRKGSYFPFFLEPRLPGARRARGAHFLKRFTKSELPFGRCAGDQRSRVSGDDLAQRLLTQLHRRQRSER